MKLKHLCLWIVVMVILSGCGSSTPAEDAQEVVVAPTMAEVQATMVLPTLTPSVAPQEVEPPLPPNAYPEPMVFPTSYPEPLPFASPTATPIPFPLISTLPLTATWFTDGDDYTSCGSRLYVRTPQGDLFEWEQSFAAQLPRPNSTPLLLACITDPQVYNRAEIRIVDVTQGTSVPLALNQAETLYQVRGAILSPDGRYVLFDGEPERALALSSEDFWGIYRADIMTGEVVPMIQYTVDVNDFEKMYNEAGAVWDAHIFVGWDERGLLVRTIASGDHHIWRFTWDEDAPMPYSVAAGTLTVESLDAEGGGWTGPNQTPYDEPSLPTHVKRPILIYEPTP